MLTFKPHTYQQTAIDWALDHDKCGLLLPMGLGKTSITLTAIKELMYDRFTVRRVLIIAPIRVAQSTWPAEIQKWEHTSDLSYSLILGTAKDREHAVMQDADIYLINRENVCWLVDNYHDAWKWDMVVIDELSSFKNPKAQRFKALRKVMPLVDRFIGLTGTPSPKGLPDLWSQVYLMDQGASLGKTLSEFRRRYLVPGRRNGHVIYDWELQTHAERRIYDAIAPICMSLDNTSVLQLPDVSYINYPVTLSSRLLQQYRNFKKEKIMEVNEGGVITAANAGVVCNKLLQYASGAIYDEEHQIQHIHDLKLEALEDLLEAANGNPVIVFYYFKFEYDRIRERFGQQYKIRSIECQQDITDWDNGEIDILLINPASAGHGLNLQAGGHIIIWYTLPNWNLELYQQANARLDRQGQREPVSIYHIICKQTIDEDMLSSLNDKDASQQRLLDALKMEE